MNIKRSVYHHVVSRRRIVPLALLALLCSVATVTCLIDRGMTGTPLERFAGVDFYDYYFAGVLWREGLNPYDATRADQLALAAGVPIISGSHFIYPPWTAAAMAPWTMLSPEAAFSLWSMASVISLGATVWVLRAASVPCSGAFMVLGPPTLFSLAVGQCNHFILFLVSAAWVLRSRRPAIAGALIAVAGSVKVAPLLFLAAAPKDRRGPWFIGASTVLLAMGTLSELVVAGGVQTWWTEALGPATEMSTRLAHPVNQGLDGAVARTLLSNEWTLPIVEMDAAQVGWLANTTRGIALLASVAWAWRRINSRTGRTWRVWSLLAIVSVLASPLAWESAFTALTFAFVLHARHARSSGAGWCAAAMGLLIAQRALDAFGNNPTSMPLVRTVSPLCSLGFLGGICSIMAVRPWHSGGQTC